MNPPTHLDRSHPTTSFSADQMIQFARAVGLEVSIAYYSMLEDLLLKARGGSRAHPVKFRYPAGQSPFPSFAGLSKGDSVASRSAYSLPTITETEGTDVIVSRGVAEEPCSSKQADARLAMRGESSERPGTDSLKTLQQIKSSQRKKKSHSCKWSREGRLNPLLPSGADKGGYVITEKMLELAPFTKVFATGSIRWKTSTVFTVCCAGEKFLSERRGYMNKSVISNGIAIFEQISGSEKSIVLGKFVVVTGECRTVQG